MTDQMLARLRRSAKQFAFIPRLMAMLWRSGPARYWVGCLSLLLGCSYRQTDPGQPVVDRLPCWLRVALSNYHSDALGVVGAGAAMSAADSCESC